MRWSKLRVLVRELFTDQLQRRVDIHSARYGACTCGHAWLTLDGAVIANFCTRAKSVALGLEAGSPSSRSLYDFASYGEFSRQDAYKACWAYVHELSIEEAIVDADPLVQSLAMLDRRIGKRKLRTIDANLLHPLAKRLLHLRRETEESLQIPTAA